MSMKSINLMEVLSDEDLHTISTIVWKTLDDAGIQTNDSAELSIKVYDEDHIIDMPEFNSLCDI